MLSNDAFFPGAFAHGAAYRPEEYISRPKLEAAILERLANRRPVLLWSRRGQGRTWLRERVVAAWTAAAPQRRAIKIDVRRVDLAGTESLAAFFRWLLGEALAALPGAPAPPLDRLWQGSDKPAAEFEYALYDHVLQPAPAGVLLALDHVDALLRLPFHAELVAALDSLARGVTADAHLARLSLLITVSTDPRRLRLDNANPPFRRPLGGPPPFCADDDPIEVGDLEPAEISTLIARHRISPATADRWTSLLGGHPRLLRAALADVAAGTVTLDTIERGELHTGHLADCLWRLRARIEGDTWLSLALQRKTLTAPGEETLEVLLRQGVVTGTPDVYKLRRRLFIRLLHDSIPPAPRRRRTMLVHTTARDGGPRLLLDRAFTALQRDKIIHSWECFATQRQLEYYEPRDMLESADLSVFFLNAGNLVEPTWQWRLDRARRGTATWKTRLLPILVTPCDWRSSIAASLPILPASGIPTDLWTDPLDAWLDIAAGLRSEFFAAEAR